MDYHMNEPNYKRVTRVRRIVRRNPWLWLIFFILTLQLIPGTIVEYIWGKRMGDWATPYLAIPGTIAALYCLSCVRENIEDGDQSPP